MLHICILRFNLELHKLRTHSSLGGMVSLTTATVIARAC